MKSDYIVAYFVKLTNFLTYPNKIQVYFCFITKIIEHTQTSTENCIKEHVHV